jgi:hypothetical protein
MLAALDTILRRILQPSNCALALVARAATSTVIVLAVATADHQRLRQEQSELSNPEQASHGTGG